MHSASPRQPSPPPTYTTIDANPFPAYPPPTYTTASTTTIHATSELPSHSAPTHIHTHRSPTSTVTTNPLYLSPGPWSAPAAAAMLGAVLHAPPPAHTHTSTLHQSTNTGSMDASTIEAGWTPRSAGDKFRSTRRKWIVTGTIVGLILLCAIVTIVVRKLEDNAKMKGEWGRISD